MNGRMGGDEEDDVPDKESLKPHFPPPLSLSPFLNLSPSLPISIHFSFSFSISHQDKG